MITRFKIRKRIKPFSNRPNFKIFRWSKKKRVCYYECFRLICYFKQKLMECLATTIND